MNIPPPLPSRYTLPLLLLLLALVPLASAQEDPEKDIALPDHQPLLSFEVTTPSSDSEAEPEAIAIEDLLKLPDSEPALRKPTILLFISGHHVKLINEYGDSKPNTNTPPASPIEPPLEQPAATGASVRGRVLIKIIDPPNKRQDAKGYTARTELLSISIVDREGEEKLTEKKEIEDGFEVRTLEEFVSDLSQSGPTPKQARHILDLVTTVTGYSMLNKNAARVAQALDKVVLVKHDDGARGAVIYVNGETNRSFYDELNASSLDIPIASYRPREGSPEGFRIPPDKPVTVVILNDQGIAKTFSFSEQELKDLDPDNKETADGKKTAGDKETPDKETDGKAKLREVLITYLGLFKSE